MTSREYSNNIAYLCNNLSPVLFIAFIFSGFMVTVYGGNSRVNAMVIDKNNKIVVGGFIDNGNALDFLIIRYNQDGTFDTTFNPTGPFPGIVSTSITDADNVINGLAIDPFNRIIAVGFVRGLLAVNAVVARYNEDGTLDTTFNAEGDIPGIMLTAVSEDTDDEATAVTLDNFNRIVVVGNSLFLAERSTFVARLNEDGSFDENFNPTGNILTIIGNELAIEPGSIFSGVLLVNVSDRDEEASAVKIDRSNRIVVGGSAFLESLITPMVYRLDPDGFSLDETFNPEGILFPLGPNILPPGIVATQGQLLDIANVPQDIGLESALPARFFDIALDSENNIVGVGNLNVAGVNIVLAIRYTDEGILDITFNPTGVEEGGIFNFSFSEVNNEARSVQIDSDNRIVISGFTFVEQIGAQFLTLRILHEGVLDPSFRSIYRGDVTIGFVITPVLENSLLDAEFTRDQANVVLIDSDNRILVGGFSSDTVSLNVTLIRYLTSGDLDASFDPDRIQSGVLVTRVPIGPVLNPFLIGVPLEQAVGFGLLGPQMISRLASAHQGFIPPVILTKEEHIFTNDEEFVLRGVSHPNALVTLFIDGEPMITVLADPYGKWAIPLPLLEDETYELQVVATDVLSNLALTSNIIKLTVDTTLPSAPTIISPAPGFTNQNPVIIRGTSEPGTIVQLFINNQQLAQTVKVGSNGNWVFRLADLPDGRFNVYVAAIDFANNISEPSNEVIFIKDTKAPVVPRITLPAPDSTINKQDLIAVGRAKPHTQVDLILNNKNIGKTLVNPDGKWVFDIKNLNEGTYTLQLRTVDPISGRKLASMPHRFEVRLKVRKIEVTAAQQGNTAPKSIVTFSPAGPTGLITGLAEPNSQISLSIDNKPYRQIQVNSAGAWVYTPQEPLKVGSHLAKISLTNAQTGQKTVIETSFLVQ